MSSAGITFHLIRHGHYECVGRILAGRTPGYALSADGKVQAERVAAALASRGLAGVVSSPLQRARETAAPIAEACRVPVVIEPGFNEIDFGDWTGAEFTSLHGMPAWQGFNSFRSTAAVPGGETMLAAQVRAVAALAVARDRFGESEVAIVSHGDVIKAVLAHFLAVPLDLFRRIEIAPASRSELRLYPAHVRVLGVNLPPGV